MMEVWVKTSWRLVTFAVILMVLANTGSFVYAIEERDEAVTRFREILAKSIEERKRILEPIRSEIERFRLKISENKPADEERKSQFDTLLRQVNALLPGVDDKLDEVPRGFTAFTDPNAISIARTLSSAQSKLHQIESDTSSELQSCISDLEGRGESDLVRRLKYVKSSSSDHSIVLVKLNEALSPVWGFAYAANSFSSPCHIDKELLHGPSFATRESRNWMVPKAEGFELPASSSFIAICSEAAPIQTLSNIVATEYLFGVRETSPQAFDFAREYLGKAPARRSTIDWIQTEDYKKSISENTGNIEVEREVFAVDEFVFDGVLNLVANQAATVSMNVDNAILVDEIKKFVQKSKVNVWKFLRDVQLSHARPNNSLTMDDFVVLCTEAETHLGEYFDMSSVSTLNPFNQERKLAPFRKKGCIAIQNKSGNDLFGVTFIVSEGREDLPETEIQGFYVPEFKSNATIILHNASPLALTGKAKAQAFRLHVFIDNKFVIESVLQCIKAPRAITYRSCWAPLVYKERVAFEAIHVREEKLLSQQIDSINRLVSQINNLSPVANANVLEDLKKLRQLSKDVPNGQFSRLIARGEAALETGVAPSPLGGNASLQLVLMRSFLSKRLSEINDSIYVTKDSSPVPIALAANLQKAFSVEILPLLSKPSETDLEGKHKALLVEINMFIEKSEQILSAMDKKSTNKSPTRRRSTVAKQPADVPENHRETGVFSDKKLESAMKQHVANFKSTHELRNLDATSQSWVKNALARYVPWTTD